MERCGPIHLVQTGRMVYKGVLAQSAKPLHAPADETFEVLFRSTTHEYGPLRFHAYFGQKPLYRANPDLGPVITLGQAALPVGAGHNEKPLRARFQGVKEVLGIGLAAARQLRDMNTKILLHPLAS